MERHCCGPLSCCPWSQGVCGKAPAHPKAGSSHHLQVSNLQEFKPGYRLRPLQGPSHQDSPSSPQQCLGFCILSVLNKSWGLMPNCSLQKGWSKATHHKETSREDAKVTSPTHWGLDPPPTLCVYGRGSLPPRLPQNCFEREATLSAAPPAYLCSKASSLICPRLH